MDWHQAMPLDHDIQYHCPVTPRYRQGCCAESGEDKETDHLKRHMDLFFSKMPTIQKKLGKGGMVNSKNNINNVM